MNMHETFAPSAGASGESAPVRTAWLGLTLAAVTAWAKSCADYYDAAALYERLSALSDTELKRRGLSRATLGQDMCAACDRTAEPRARV